VSFYYPRKSGDCIWWLAGFILIRTAQSNVVTGSEEKGRQKQELMTTTRLIRISKGLYRTKNGNLRVSFWSWEKREHGCKWKARWTDFMNTQHEIRAETFDQLNRRLAPYGMRLSK
jgi:hypothetical protein